MQSAEGPAKMNEDQLRTLVRDVIRRQLAARGDLSPALSGVDVLTHPSHARFGLTRGADADGPCLIESGVACMHCGYCQSRGY